MVKFPPFFGQVVKQRFLRVWYCPKAEEIDGRKETEAAYGRVQSEGGIGSHSRGTHIE
jgi:hypothetical protein